MTTIGCRRDARNIALFALLIAGKNFHFLGDFVYALRDVCGGGSGSGQSGYSKNERAVDVSALANKVCDVNARARSRLFATKSCFYSASRLMASPPLFMRQQSKTKLLNVFDFVISALSPQFEYVIF